MYIDQSISFDYAKPTMTQFEFYQSIDSTNDEAKRLYRKNKAKPDYYENGIVVVSEVQTKGKGQQNKSWFSETSDGLYYSFLIIPNQFDFKKTDQYKIDIGQQVIEVIKEQSGLEAVMEWPNDILLNNKKVAGILLETALQSGKSLPTYIVIGIGLNINHNEFPDELKPIATSLKLVSGREYEKNKFITALTERLKNLWK